MDLQLLTLPSVNKLHTICLELSGDFQIKDGEEAVCKVDNIEIGINKYGTLRIKATARLPKYFKSDIMYHPLETEALLKRMWTSTLRDINTILTPVKDLINKADRMKIQLEIDLTKY